MKRHPGLLLTLPLLVITACGAAADPTGQPVPPAATTPPTTVPPTTVPPTTSPPTTSPHAVARYDATALRAELDAARARWTELGWDSYRFTYVPSCFCPQDEIVVDVLGGRVLGPTDPGGRRSVDQWFDEIDAAIGPAADVRVAYGDTGAPTSVYIDVDELMADEEFGFELLALEPVTDGPETFLDDEYPCGYGFAIADAGQTTAMVVSFTDIQDIDVSPALGTYALADLEGTVRFGTDLMANWCDDVTEPGEPEAVVDESWDIVAGTLELTGVENRLAFATLTDVVAVAPDGTEHRLGTVGVSNDGWGVFAG